ncbi:Site-specific recombinase XerD [Nostocoides australiense Ben110]|uniref:Site-specific recombinase XerD n=3 Tax=Nostocoides TaxID=99479 RepID=W6JWW0_9MICO|nr:tyrosine-type recombinase/integrase [Tetrasphaera australiensis]CCH73597.1 Site-specific recombinase XerD [Tetrasphaera australiensis Ben110]CCH74758.1 Site-specific recombinase XerD [Tetrasphaera australiensis Ben110]
MPRAAVNAKTVEPRHEPPAEVLAAYHAHQARTGRGNTAFTYWAKTFLRRWPVVRAWEHEPLAVQLTANSGTRPFITFLLVTGRLHPSWEYLVHRKFSSIWRDVPGTVIGQDLAAFITAARGCGYSQRVASAMASQVIARVLFATGKRLTDLVHDDFDALAVAGLARQAATGRTWKHYRATATGAKTVLYHHGVLPALPEPFEQRWPFARRLAHVPEPMHAILVRYLQHKSVTCRPATVSSLATRLAAFGAYLAGTDPDATPATLDRCQHIEPWLASLTTAANTKAGGTLSVPEQARRILAVANFLTEITEWGWPEAPTRRLMFPSDNPRLPQPLPRFLPPDADRRLTEALEASPHRLAADALLLQRACGLRIGELLDLELDAVIDLPGSGSWLKVPLGKLDTERMVPIDAQILALIDRITAARSPGRPIPHPRTGRPADFLFTAHGHRIGQNRLRKELDRAAKSAGIGHVTPHQLRHTYATALVNAGVSLQALMAILGHVSAEMSLRYGHLFDTTVRAEYERALELAKQTIGALPTPSEPTSSAGDDWRTTATVKTALAGGYCLRAPAQGPCSYANICEHCPSFHTTTTYLPVLTAQRDDAAALAADATTRGWDAETERHLRLIHRLTALIDDTATHPTAM